METNAKIGSVPKIKRFGEKSEFTTTAREIPCKGSRSTCIFFGRKTIVSLILCRSRSRGTQVVLIVITVYGYNTRNHNNIT